MVCLQSVHLQSASLAQYCSVGVLQAVYLQSVHLQSASLAQYCSVGVLQAVYLQSVHLQSASLAQYCSVGVLQAVYLQSVHLQLASLAQYCSGWGVTQSTSPVHVGVLQVVSVNPFTVNFPSPPMLHGWGVTGSLFTVDPLQSVCLQTVSYIH